VTTPAVGAGPAGTTARADDALRETRSTCPYCGVGCGVIVQTRGAGAQAEVVGVRGDPAHPANAGRLCTKGASLHLTAQPLRYRQSRIARPELRAARDAARAPVDWDTALDAVAGRFARCIREHGPDSVAFYVSGQLLTEDYYVFNKLAKGLVGTNNIDTNSRLCMSSAVAGYKATLGADAPPAAYEDIERAECLFIAGSNTAWAHPVLFRRIEAAKAARPQMRIVVVDPRRTDTAAFADLHLPILPGTDVALFAAMLHQMLWEGWIDRTYIDAHTEGFDALRDAVRETTPARAATICGVDAQAIVTAARWFACSPATLSLYCQGLNQSAHGTDKNAALIDLHLACGQIGRPGAGPLSLTGQPNAMGGREVGGMATLMSAHRDLANAADRAELAAFWGVEAVPARPGRTAVQMFDALASGEIRMIWIACTNPAHSLPDSARVHAALRRAEFVVVQEAFRGTATADFADVLLPATTWPEKSGTVTNSERRISRVRAAVAPHADARDDWTIAVEVARRLETRLRPGARTLFPYADAEQVWNEHRDSTRGRDLDITGLSYARLDAEGPQQWPCAEPATAGRTRLYEDGRFPTPSGRARFAAVRYEPVAEPVDARHPLRLLTGRLRDQWHGMSRTGTLGRLFEHSPEPTLQLGVEEFARRGLHAGELVRVRSRRGVQVLPVAPSDTLRGATAWLPMHWGPESLGGHDAGNPSLGVNTLTLPACDPVSGQPELKHAAIRVDRVELPARVTAFGWLPAGRAVEARLAIARWLGDGAGGCRFAYASCTAFGRDEEGVLLRIADRAPLAGAELDVLQALFGVDPATLLRYDDPRRAPGGATRRLAIVGGALRFALLAGDTAPEAWLRAFLDAGTPVAVFGRSLLMPSATPPAGFVARGRTVCACLGVSETAIREALAAVPGAPAERLELVQSSLRCGTQCGSCLPELRQLAEAVAPARAPADAAH
jgi:assimilatory nitrate reductase catalytic subunit